MQTQAAKICTAKGKTEVSFMISLLLRNVGAKRSLALVKVTKLTAFPRFIADSSFTLSFLISN